MTGRLHDPETTPIDRLDPEDRADRGPTVVTLTRTSSVTAPPAAGTPKTPETPETPGNPDGPRQGLSARLAIAVVALLALVVVGCITLGGGGEPAGPAPLGAPAPVGGPAPAPAAAIAPLDVATPVRVHLPSIGADSSLVGVGIDAQSRMQVPPTTQPMQAAWYDRAPTPGAAGPSMIIGHVNGDHRPGIFAHLSTLRVGDQVEVDRVDGRTAVFTVYQSETVPKDAFPTQRVYGNVPDAQLRLVTCGGDFDPAVRSYESNVIVYAHLTGVRET